MNSLLGGLMNFSNPAPAAMPMGSSGPSLLMQALGAAMRGEDPRTFLQNLAQSHPQLKQYDFTNLQATAEQVCRDHNIDPNQVAANINNVLAQNK